MIDEEEKYLMDIEDKVTDIPDWFTVPSILIPSVIISLIVCIICII